ncbi:hypothetical protein D3C81_1968170 [compost metagenome]
MAERTDVIVLPQIGVLLFFHAGKIVQPLRLREISLEVIHDEQAVRTGGNPQARSGVDITDKKQVIKVLGDNV